MDAIPTVSIDPEGVFKYIQIVISDGASTKTIVRGYAADEYHGEEQYLKQPSHSLAHAHKRIIAADIYDRVTPSLEQAKVRHHCPGGGRIRHEKGKSLFVYGYSQVRACACKRHHKKKKLQIGKTLSR
jgi:hypothetical protein